MQTPVPPGASVEPHIDSRWQVRVQSGDFDLGAEVAGMRSGDTGIGAVVCFVGTVRDVHPSVPPAVSAQPEVQWLELEHYPGMTESAMAAMLEGARERFGLRAGRIVHRIGRLAPADQIVLVATGAAHRDAAFHACAFLMDWLKTQAPFWKRAHTAEGTHWVSARSTDDEALARWGVASRNAGAEGA